MGNRRSPISRKRIVRTPDESRAGFQVGQRLRSARSALQWVVLGLKFGAGLGLLVAAIVALAFGVFHYARTTPRFSVVTIEVEGTKRLIREDVLRAAALARGQNLFSIDVEQTEKKLLESPWISAVRVSRRLPGTVRLEISEREAAAIALVENQTFLVDSQGVPFKTLGQGDPHDLPMVTGISARALLRDRRAEQDRILQALVLLREYERLSVSQEMAAQEVHLDPAGGAVLTVGRAGTTLSLGLPPWKKKLLRAERVLSKTKQSGGKPSVLFLDNEAHPERVVVRVQ